MSHYVSNLLFVERTTLIEGTFLGLPAERSSGWSIDNSREGIVFTGAGRTSIAGKLHGTIWHFECSQRPAARASGSAPDPLAKSVIFEHLGFSAAHDEAIGDYGHVRSVSIQLPHWAIVGFFAILPSHIGFHWLRKQTRQNRGFCIWCGYDVRATPERCPECGAVETTISS